MFDLALALTEGQAGLDGAWEYRTDLFDAATAGRLALAFGHLLADAVARPDLAIGRLDLLGEAARHQLTREWNDTAADFPREATLTERFARRAARSPRATALAGPAPGEAMTYGELDARSTALARRLAARGVGPEVRVALLLERSPALVVATLAAAKAGGAYVPLDPAYPDARLAFMLADSRAAVLVTHRGLAARLGAIGLPVLDLDLGPDLDLEAAGLPPLPTALPDNLAYVMYTSGSTGVPKGVAVTTATSSAWSRGRPTIAFGPQQTFLQLAPASFDAATLEIWGPLLHGGRLALAHGGAGDASPRSPRRSGITASRRSGSPPASSTRWSTRSSPASPPWPSSSPAATRCRRRGCGRRSRDPRHPPRQRLRPDRGRPPSPAALP